jgi:hypothetical protein
MIVRNLGTCETNGTAIVLKKNGQKVGTIVGSYPGGFVVKADADGKECMLPFTAIGNYSVIVEGN